MLNPTKQTAFIMTGEFLLPWWHKWSVVYKMDIQIISQGINTNRAEQQINTSNNPVLWFTKFCRSSERFVKVTHQWLCIPTEVMKHDIQTKLQTIHRMHAPVYTESSSRTKRRNLLFSKKSSMKRKCDCYFRWFSCFERGIYLIVWKPSSTLHYTWK